MSQETVQKIRERVATDKEFAKLLKEEPQKALTDYRKDLTEEEYQDFIGGGEQKIGVMGTSSGQVK